MSDSAPSFNLWHEPWIDVLDRDGNPLRLGIRECLRNADLLGDLASPSPITVIGTHRLLVAILQFIHQPLSLADLERLLQRERFDPSLLDAFENEHAFRFDLFSPEWPFMQDRSVKTSSKDRRPVSRLFPELPTGINRAFFHHVTDADHAICPACCAGGLMQIAPFSLIGGAGYRAGINGTPPIYTVFAANPSLHQALCLSLVSEEWMPETAQRERAFVAPWTNDNLIGHVREIHDVGLIEGLLFPSRQVRLFPENGSVACTHCGRLTPVHVSAIHYKSGHWRSRESPLWRDPNVAYADAPEPYAILPRPGMSLWTEFARLLLMTGQNGHSPIVLSQMRQLRLSRPAVRTRHVWLGTHQANCLEWQDHVLETPLGLFEAEPGATDVRFAIQCAYDIAKVMGAAYRKHFGKLPVATQVGNHMRSRYWHEIGQSFPGFIERLSQAYASGDDLATTVLERWQAAVKETALRVALQAINQIEPSGKTLRALVRGRDHLTHAINRKAVTWNK